MKKLIILDFGKIQCHVYTINVQFSEDEDDRREEIIDLIQKFGHNHDDCYFMVVDNDSQIILH